MNTALIILVGCVVLYFIWRAWGVIIGGLPQPALNFATIFGAIVILLALLWMFSVLLGKSLIPW